jgi:ABC-2 type transport system permease protein
MIRRIARKEFIEIQRDGRFRWTAAAVGSLLIAALLIGWKHYAQADRQIRDASVKQRELWLNTPDRNPHAAAHHGMYVFKPVMPLSAVDDGIDEYAGASFFLEAHDQNLSQNKAAEDTTAVQRFGDASAAITLQTLIPLLILLLVFPVFAGEREQGTLRQLVSLGVSRRDLAIGKALGSAGLLMLLLIPATLIGVLAMWLNTTHETLAASIPRMLVMALGYLAYFVVFIGLSLIVSAKAPTARLAFVTLISFWFINCLVAPRIMADVARHTVGVPTTLEFLQAIDDDKARVSIADRQKRVVEQLLAQYGVQKEEDLPVDPFGAHLIEGEKYDSAIYERHINRLFDAYERQERIYNVGAVFAPMLSIQTLSMGLAGTDFKQHRHFADAVSAYRLSWLDVLNEDIFHNRRPGELSYSRGRDLWEQVPEMNYEPPSLMWVMGNHTRSIAALGCWLVAILVATPLTLVRIRID